MLKQGPLRRSLAVTTETALQLAARLVDPASFEVVDATLTCPTGASGFWTPPVGHALAADFPDGAVVLSTGQASIADKLSSTSNQGGVGNGAPGDPDVSAVVGTSTYDSCSLSITAKAKTKGKISFQYVFASEEYPEYVNQYNDGFLLLFSDITTPKTNVAIVPGTDPAQAVTINTVNAGVNSNFFRSNSGGTEYDGMTTLLPTKPIILQADEVFSFKLVIADAADNIYDSAVFIKANSVSLFNKCDKPCATGTVAADSCQVDSVCQWNDLIEPVCSGVTNKEDGAACAFAGLGSSSVAGACDAGVCQAPSCSSFDGFLPPIAAKDENVLATASSTIPVKWSLTNPDWGQLAPGYPRLVPIACGTDPAPSKTDAGEFLADALATLKLTPTQAAMTFQGKGHVEAGKCYRFDVLLAGCARTQADIRSFRIRVK
ncbi:hypothetical protein HXX76_012405 [Chlamydomonas incerta]|uniref:Uncharacterized protein n=1 Tax=Chlamydomonas incerta TaxID=51695 RepID=A0A835VVX5_CHLIN|nr:hypothetical protein HXX76_012405 [Chlamydomonas incerta]|eukprot:KAG2427469.1 hypothetical protein HXX76_012405 [Chlamydomonas incerta]